MGKIPETIMIRNFFIRMLHIYQSSFNEDKYWKRRLYLQKMGGVKSAWYMLYCRRVESKKCASTGIGHPEFCCQISDRIRFPHGLCGIIIARNVRIGKNVTIYQHVTIAESDKGKQTIVEDNVMIGAGAVILNNVHIGIGAKIGANAVVISNVPAGCTVVGVPAKIVRNKEYT